MELTIEVVRHIAQLARIELSPEELTRYQEQLSAVLEHFEKLQAVDTTGIEPTSSVLPAHSVLRPDKARPGLPREKLLENAPSTENHRFRVPPVIE